MDDAGLLDVLLDLERAGWASLCDGTGADFYGSVMTGDGLMVLANGAILDRAAVISALQGAPAWQRFDIEDVRLVGSGRDAAALAYVGRAYRGDDDDPFSGAMTSLYVRDGAEWRLALYTQTPVPGQAASE